MMDFGLIFVLIRKFINIDLSFVCFDLKLFFLINMYFFLVNFRYLGTNVF